MKTKGLYVHIPFCGAICHYCDFVKVIYHKPWVNPYLERLNADLAFFNVSTKLSTIYVGGGTPTSLSEAELRTLLELLAPYAKDVVEYTFEANVESITKEKLLLLRAYGVNRLSIGVQTTDDKRLAFLNRKHTYAQIKAAIKLVKEVGFTNFSVDLIYGLPSQDEEALFIDLNNILELDAPHISTYALTIEQNTLAFIRNWPRVSDDQSRLFYDLILALLRTKGYNRYEVSNFAKPGYESIHNKHYWHNDEYYAIGLGASGYLKRKRYVITGGLTRYLSGTYKLDEENITDNMYIEEYFMLNLRLSDGFTLLNFKEQTGLDLLLHYESKIKKLVEEGLLLLDEQQLKCTDEGLMLLDYVVLTLIA